LIDCPIEVEEAAFPRRKLLPALYINSWNFRELIVAPTSPCSARLFHHGRNIERYRRKRFKAK
jgi:hypothetical protein